MSEAISVKCPACDAKLKLKSASAVGKKVACPKCKKPFVVPAPPEDDEEDFMSLSEPEPDEFGESNDEAPADDELPEVPSRRKTASGGKKKSKGSAADWQKPILLGLGGLALVALLGGGGFLAFNLAGDLFSVKNKIDLTHLDPDSDFIVHLRVNETLQAPFIQSLVTMPAVKAQIDKIQQEIGVDPATITSLTMGQTGMVKSLSQGNKNLAAPLGVIRAKAPFDADKLTSGNLPFEKQEHSGKTYYIRKGQGPANPGLALYLPKADTLVIGTEQDVKQSIERGKKTVRRADLDYVDTTRHLLIVFAPKEISDFDEPPKPPSQTGAPSLGARVEAITAGKTKGICLGLSINDGIDWSATVNSTTPDVPVALSAEIDRSVKETKAQLEQFKPMLPPELSDVMKTGEEMLNSIRATPKDSTLEVAGKVPSSVKTAVEKALSALGPAMLQGLLPGMTPPGAGAPPGSEGSRFPGGPMPGGFPPGELPPGFPQNGPSSGGNPNR